MTRRPRPRHKMESAWDEPKEIHTPRNVALALSMGYLVLTILVFSDGVDIWDLPFFLAGIYGVVTIVGLIKRQKALDAAYEAHWQEWTEFMDKTKDDRRDFLRERGAVAYDMLGVHIFESNWTKWEIERVHKQLDKEHQEGEFEAMRDELVKDLELFGKTTPGGIPRAERLSKISGLRKAWRVKSDPNQATAENDNG